MPDDNPVACCLTDAELRQREATLLAQFKSALTATEEIADGYAFRIPGGNRWLALVPRRFTWWLEQQTVPSP